MKEQENESQEQTPPKTEEPKPVEQAGASQEGENVSKEEARKFLEQLMGLQMPPELQHIMNVQEEFERLLFPQQPIIDKKKAKDDLIEKVKTLIKNDTLKDQLLQCVNQDDCDKFLSLLRKYLSELSAPLIQRLDSNEKISFKNALILTELLSLLNTVNSKTPRLFESSSALVVKEIETNLNDEALKKRLIESINGHEVREAYSMFIDSYGEMFLNSLVLDDQSWDEFNRRTYEFEKQVLDKANPQEKELLVTKENEQPAKTIPQPAPTTPTTPATPQPAAKKSVWKNLSVFEKVLSFLSLGLYYAICIKRSKKSSSQKSTSTPQQQASPPTGRASSTPAPEASKSAPGVSKPAPETSKPSKPQASHTRAPDKRPVQIRQPGSQPNKQSAKQPNK